MVSSSLLTLLFFSTGSSGRRTVVAFGWTDPFGLSFDKVFVYFSFHFLVAGEGSSSIPRPLLRSSSRGWSIKPVTPPSSSSFFLPPTLGPCAASLPMFCLCTVPAAVYLCRFECGNVRQSKDAVVVWFFFIWFFYFFVWLSWWLALFLLLNHGVVEDNTANPCLCSHGLLTKRKIQIKK